MIMDIFDTLYSICLGAFISGLALTIMLMILSAINLSGSAGDTDTGSDVDSDVNTELDHSVDGDHSVNLDHSMEVDQSVEVDQDVDLDHSTDMDQSVDIDHSIEVDHSVDVDQEAGLDHSMEVDHSADIDQDVNFSNQTLHTTGNVSDINTLSQEKYTNQSVNKKGTEFIITQNKAPFMLIFSMYLLWFGAIGMILAPRLNNPMLWAIIVISIPIALARLLAMIWIRISRNVFYKVDQGIELIGRKASVKIEVTAVGGTVSVQNEYLTQQLPVKSLYPKSIFHTNDEVYICDYRNQTYFVDAFPGSIRYRKRNSNIK